MKTYNTHTILRKEILRDSYDHYVACRRLKAANVAEVALYTLKIAECQAMLLELPPVTKEENYCNENS